MCVVVCSLLSLFVLVEQVLELAEDLVLQALVGAEVIGLLELLHRGLLVAAQGLGDVDADVHQEVARTIAIDAGQTLAAQA